MFKSATFAIGIILALGAFVGFIFLGNFLAPPPASVVVALRDIPPYTPLDATMLGVDAQHLNGQVLATLVQKQELDPYLGGFVTTPIYAGEPLRKSAVVMQSNPLASKRLALALTDSNRVAAVIPVNAQTAPEQIVTGDYVDLVISMAPGNLASGSTNQFGQIIAGQENSASSVGFGPSAVITPTRNSVLPSLLSATGVLSGSLPGEAMNLPVTKAVIRDVPVLAVAFDQTPNPTYASAGFGDTGNAAPPQPAYVDGEIKSVTVSVPRENAELLNFGIDNGKVHVMLLPVQKGETEFAAQKNDPTLGVSWNDVLAFMIQERQALGIPPNLTVATNGASGGTNSSAANPSESPNSSSPTPTLSADGKTGKNSPPPATNSTTVPTTLQAPTPQPTPTVVTGLAVPTTIAGIVNGVNNAVNGGNPSNSTNGGAPQNGTSAPQQNQLATGLDISAILVPLACGFLFLLLAIIVIRVIRRRRMTHVTP